MKVFVNIYGRLGGKLPAVLYIRNIRQIRFLFDKKILGDY
jgi:hypothetical protein